MALDQYIKRPDEMVNYLSNYGWHFNKKSCDYATKLMRRKNPATNKLEKIDQLQKDQVDEILTKNGVTIENNKGYDYVYVFHMAKADFWKSSIEDEKHLALFVKDMIDDPDQEPGFVFRRWYSDMICAGEPIEWSELT